MSETNERELKIERIVDLPQELIWRCWTEPKHLMPWYCPKPWVTTECRIDLRVGGEFFALMISPEGINYPGAGVYLEVVKNKRLVWTDAYTKGWQPSENPFFTGIIELEDLGGGKTKYTARALHWTVENCNKHKEMGFHQGWNTALDQLIEYTKEM